MTIRYVGPGGSDGASGLTWVLRKETLTGVEDTPVVAGDTVYVGPGVYRETLTVDISGSAGNIITYIGDTTGENTDGIGGIVRITGSDDDSGGANARSTCVTLTGKTHRTFSHLYLDEISGQNGYIILDGEDNLVTDIIVEYCVFGPSWATHSGSAGVTIDGSIAGMVNMIVRNCVSLPAVGSLLNVVNTDTETDVDTLLENCLSLAPDGAIYISNAYGITISGCSTMDMLYGARDFGLATTGQLFMYDSMAWRNYENINEGFTNAWVEDYNTLAMIRYPFSEGANTVSTIIVRKQPILYAGYKYPWNPYEFTDYHSDVYGTDTGALTVDAFGLTRPGSGKRTRGGIQFYGSKRDATFTRKKGPSIKLEDANRHVVTIPVKGNGTLSLSAYAYRETDYAGTAPQLVIKRPGKSDSIITDAGSVDIWNKLDASIDVDGTFRFIQIELRSNNTASSGNYVVWFADLRIKAKGVGVPTIRWATEQHLLYAITLDDVVDPWITPVTIVPTYGPESVVGPFPTFFRG